MSDMAMADWSMRADELSVEDMLSVIAMLIDKFKKRFSAEKKASFVDEMFEIADKNASLHKSEEKWTRDELYRY
mgnify:CR=1 FL=1